MLRLPSRPAADLLVLKALMGLKVSGIRVVGGIPRRWDLPISNG